jgi:hypothetical protein
MVMALRLSSYLVLVLASRLWAASLSAKEFSI